MRGFLLLASFHKHYLTFFSVEKNISSRLFFSLSTTWTHGVLFIQYCNHLWPLFFLMVKLSQIYPVGAPSTWFPMFFQYSLSAFLLSGTVKYFKLILIFSLTKICNHLFSKDPCFLSESNLGIRNAHCHAVSLSADTSIGDNQKRCFIKKQSIYFDSPIFIILMDNQKKNWTCSCNFHACSLRALLSVGHRKMLLSAILPPSLPNILTPLVPEKPSVIVFQAVFFLLLFASTSQPG